MNDSYHMMEDKVIRIAAYFIEERATVRATAKKFGVSKSTVHKYLTENLKYIHAGMYEETRKLLSANKSVRHLRGGEATKQKYRALRKNH